MALFIPAGSERVREVAPENGTDFTLAQMYELLSCHLIEMLPIADGLIMVLDAEGKFEDKPRNERATLIANFVSPKTLVAELLRLRESGIAVIRAGLPLTDETMETDYIAGDVLICNHNEVR